MFERTPSDFLEFRDNEPPQLIVTIDTEAEFEWGAPYSRSAICVDSVSEQHRAQDIFDKYDIIPTYLVDFAVANNEDAVRTLRELHETGRCEIGSHLNPWLNPPFDEPLDRFHSYPCNLPPELERQKLARLTSRITEQFGQPPRVYRAGRYGIGPYTARILEDLGYWVDMSVVPHTSFVEDFGPDFTAFDARPFRFGPTKSLLEMPVSSGYAGWLASGGQRIFPFISNRCGMRLHVPGVFARMRALERIRLTPEGVNYDELRRLTETLLGLGCRVFSLTYHSPSLAPGNTPYVRNEEDLREFLRVVKSYVTYFRDILGGYFTTPCKIYRDT